MGLSTEPSINQFHDWLAERPRRPGAYFRVLAWIDSGLLMPLHLDRIDWMPSPPLVPDAGPIDIAHLQRMTLGDIGLEREVLGMFSAQSSKLLGALADLPIDAAALAHTLNGSARAIGAFAVADAAAHLEAQIKVGGDTAEAMAELEGAVAQACAAIEALLRDI